MHVARIAAVAVLGACVPALAACGNSSVAKADVEKQSAAAIGKLVSDPVTSTKCPGDLEATVGKSETCTMSFKSGRVVEVSATVTSIKGDNAGFDVKVTKVIKK